MFMFSFILDFCTQFFAEVFNAGTRRESKGTAQTCSLRGTFPDLGFPYLKTLSKPCSATQTAITISRNSNSNTGKRMQNDGRT